LVCSSRVRERTAVCAKYSAGTGFSPAAKGAVKKLHNEKQVAEDFMGFWKNFMETFDLTGRDVYLTGESYAGRKAQLLTWPRY
jgi:carboxypeptidase C (cathepsin A)